MHNLDVQVLDAALEWGQQHSVWFCTVLSTYGSSPRPPGAMMVIRKDGRFCGSLSGGCVEDSFITRISEGMFAEHSQIVRYGDGGFDPDRALPCGGVLDILVEKLVPCDETVEYLQQMKLALTSASAMTKKLTIPGRGALHAAGPYSGRTAAEVNGSEVTLNIAAPPRVIVAGLSSVAIFCANFAQALGFETIVCEHREEILASLAESLDEGISVVKLFPAAYLEREGCHSGTAILSLTHDPRIDDLTMMEAVNLPAFYIGAMGSIKNSVNRKERLMRIGELNAEQLSRIHAPVGLAIGSKTPSEIALSIMADIVRHKNGRVSDLHPLAS